MMEYWDLEFVCTYVTQVGNLMKELLKEAHSSKFVVYPNETKM